MGERLDRAALALASPRLLGLSACHRLPSYQGLEMSLAFHRVLGGAIDEAALRKYASRSEATPEGCKWLARVAAATGPRRKDRPSDYQIRRNEARNSIRVAVISSHKLPVNAQEALTYPYETSCQERWYLMEPGSHLGALVAVRIGKPQHTAYQYAGSEGEERLVRIEKAGIGVWHIQGEVGAERVTHIELPSGEVRLCDGHNFKLTLWRRLWQWGCVCLCLSCAPYYSAAEAAQRRAKLLADLNSLHGT